MDPTTLVSLAGSLARAGLPAISSILGAVVPPPYDLLVKPTFSAVAWALGVDPTVTNAPAVVQAKVDADPAAAAAQLKQVEDAHADAAAELQAYLADVANARSQTISLAASGSMVQWGAPVVSTIAMLGFGAVAILVMLGHAGDSAAAQLVLGAMISGWSTVLSYWLGSSKGGSDRAEAIASMLHQTITTGVPTSNASKRANR